MALQIRRGSKTDRLNGFVPAIAEPIYDTDGKSLWIGDGITPGGNRVGGVDYLSEVGDVNIPENASFALLTISANNNILTVQVGENHDYIVGDEIDIDSNARPVVNGTYSIATVPSSSSFTVEGIFASFTEEVDGGLVRKHGANLRSGASLFYSATSKEWTAVDPPLSNNSVLIYKTNTQTWQSVNYGLAYLSDTSILPGSVPTGSGLIWDGSVWRPGSVNLNLAATGRGDGGDFSTSESVGFVSNIYGGGNFTSGNIDNPIELNGAMDAGVF